MRKKSNPQSAFLTRRILFSLLLCTVACSITGGTLLAFFRSETPTKVSHRTLTFAERVAYQRDIEEVYWRHRIWPKERPDSKPPLDAVMSQAQLEKKVADYLRKSQALEDYWRRPITAEQLQAEMDRMAKHTKQPQVLRELFDALGNDPFVIAECLARRALADRLLTNWYAYDQRIHGELKRHAEAALLALPNVERMQQLGGSYSEIELSKSDSSKGEPGRGPEGMKLNGRDWDETVQSLAATFNHPASRFLNGRAPAIAGSRPLVPARPAVASYQTIPAGKLSPLQEDQARYYATAVIEKNNDRLKLATIAWPKEPLDSWLAKAEKQLPDAIAISTTSYTLPTISEGAGCIDNTWIATAGPPEGGGTGVWTGSEMIILNGGNLNKGARYNPSTDTWTATNTTNAPTARGAFTAVWTGKEIIVWGGIDDLFNIFNTGGRYDPNTDGWTATTTTNAPDPRYIHTAVWTGSEMIIWGGTGASYFSTGGRYNPNTDSWTPTSTINAPAGRYGPTAVWTGNEMIVWGGTNDSVAFDSGGRYNPSTDTWIATTTTNAPVARLAHTAVWSGSEMIVWGGTDIDNNQYFNTGGRYNPNTDSWTVTGVANAPAGRASHTAVWTGNEMIVWGGFDGGNYVNTGGRYNPGTNSWTATSTTNAPAERSGHIAVWTGKEMVVWGGGGYTRDINRGGRYDPNTNSWTAINTYNTPEARASHTAVWTGSEMIIWGGRDDITYLNTGGRYNPATDSWGTTGVTNAPTSRSMHTAVWTGSEMIVWGGNFYDAGYHYLNTGGRYNPNTNSWTTTSTANAPDARAYHTAVWTGSEMIIWGGTDEFNYFRTGGRYNPNTNTWAATSTTSSPFGRSSHTAVWTGTEMIVWGGFDESFTFSSTGGRYNPLTNSWTATSTPSALSGRINHTAVWTGTEMIVWGGHGESFTSLNTGGRYNPNLDNWAVTSISNAPDARELHTATWVGGEMIVWGGAYQDLFSLLLFNTGGRYDPQTDNWTATTVTNAPLPRYTHTAIWSGNEMIVWGGGLNSGGRYCAQTGPPPSPTPTPTPCTGRCSPTPRSRPMPRSRPTPPPHLTPVPPPPSPRPTPVPRPTPPSHLTPLPSPTSPRPTPHPRP
jgi:N-acetylneuraminic acid mutarotase